MRREYYYRESYYRESYYQNVRPPSHNKCAQTTTAIAVISSIFE